MIDTSIMKELTDTSVLPLALFLLYFYITKKIEKEVEIVGAKKIEAKNKHCVNQKFNTQYITRSSKTNGYQTNQ